jgi:hypothetical protein
MASSPPTLRFSLYANLVAQPCRGFFAKLANGTVFSGAVLLAIILVTAIGYILLVLPFIAGDGKPRVENILFWLAAAVLTLTLVFKNWARIDRRFFLSVPIISLIAYLVFAAASVTRAYNPDFAFSRLSCRCWRLSFLLCPTLCR